MGSLVEGAHQLQVWVVRARCLMVVGVGVEGVVSQGVGVAHHPAILTAQLLHAPAAGPW